MLACKKKKTSLLILIYSPGKPGDFIVKTDCIFPMVP